MLNLDCDDYAVAYRKLEKFAKRDESLLMFGKFGVVKNPPISDLDLFLCFSDEYLAVSRARILAYIREDRLLSYVCDHDPVIVSNSMLGKVEYLHTLYGLDLSYDRLSYSFVIPDDSYIKYLELVWATFLLPIAGTRALDVQAVDDRSNLLLLKNIHQSIDNMGSTNSELARSECVREAFIVGQIGSDEIRGEIASGLERMMTLLTAETPVKNQEAKISSYRLNRKMRISLGRADYVNLNSDKNGVIDMALSPSVWNMFELFYMLPGKADSVNYETYVQCSVNVYEITKKNDVSYPFIIPFCYPFYRKDFRFRFRRWAGLYL
ncbi:MAG: hypothetical protein WED00_02485 [Aquisalimonadaceae bacterium]